MKLFKAKIQFNMIALANDKNEAIKTTLECAGEELSQLIHINDAFSISKISCIEEIPEELCDTLPWTSKYKENPNPEELTCEEILKKSMIECPKCGLVYVGKNDK